MAQRLPSADGRQTLGHRIDQWALGRVLLASYTTVQVATRHARSWRYLRPWWGSLRRHRSPLTDETPWITYPAIEWLSAWLRPAMSVFEWGSGGSTLFLARRVARVNTIEHDAAWHGQIQKALAERRIGNVMLRLVEPDDGAPATDLATAVPDGYRSALPIMAGKSFGRYVHAIDGEGEASLDLVLVDGRARTSCLGHCLKKVKPGGAVLLDNADYDRYQPALAELRRRELAHWSEENLEGMGPYSIFGWSRTIVWTRPLNGPWPHTPDSADHAQPV